MIISRSAQTSSRYASASTGTADERVLPFRAYTHRPGHSLPSSLASALFMRGPTDERKYRCCDLRHGHRCSVPYSHRVRDTHPLDAAFREYMALPKLYQLTTIPGDPEPDHLVEVLRVPSAEAWAYAAARSHFRCVRSWNCALRKQDHNPKYGAAVQVRRLPGLATELETQWSTSFERALQRAAYAAAAHILPQTRACRSTPWHAWQTHILPTSLFRNYQRAKKIGLRQGHTSGVLQLINSGLGPAVITKTVLTLDGTSLGEFSEATVNVVRSKLLIRPAAVTFRKTILATDYDQFLLSVEPFDRTEHAEFADLVPAR